MVVYVYLDRQDIFIQNFEAKAIWRAIIDRKHICKYLKFNRTVKFPSQNQNLIHCANEWNRQN
jgi:hypothetical protein